MYTQCEIEFEDGRKEVSWIPDEFASKGKHVVIGKNKESGIKAKVVNVYARTRTDRDMSKFQNDWSKAHKRTDI